MLGSPILDVAIGMAFLYLLLSLIASATQEIIASIIQSRAANLERGIRSLFSNDSVKSGLTFVDALYSHGLVRGLYQVPSKDYKETKLRSLCRIFFGHIRLTLRWIFAMKVPGSSRDINDLLYPAYIPSRVFAMALKDILNDPQPYGWDSLRNMEENLGKLVGQGKKDPDDKNLAAEALLALVKDAAGDPKKLQANLENWYNDTMDRVSGWYKRYVQNILLGIGLILAISFNVDSIRVARTLWVDKDARTGLVTAAGDYLSKHPEAPAATSTSPNLEPKDLTSNLQKTIGAYQDAEGPLVPVGWRHTPRQYLAAWQNEGTHAVVRYLAVLLGWIITAVALSYGAPFWFDTLNKFMVVRSTIKPQEKSQIEHSKDN